jgi:diguanylate cyclase (GGDEF)-like protein
MLHIDSVKCAEWANRALAMVQAVPDAEAEGWARLTRGFHQLYFAPPEEAHAELKLALQAFEACANRPGQILATAGQARALWRSGQAAQAMALLLPLRDEGLQLLKHEQRGVLLNAIAGCFSAQGSSDDAFAYMYEALRHAGPARGRGFDAALYCNLSHELMELGDHDQALEQIQRGLARCEGMRNARLESVLRINRVVVLTELGRAADAQPDVDVLRQLGATPTGRGTRALHFETLAIAALRAGRAALGQDLLQQAQALQHTLLPDERVELAVALALQAWQGGDTAAALQALAQVQPLLSGGPDGAAPRASAMAEQLASELHEARGDAPAALAALRRWQALNARRASMASRARYQAAVLQTELLQLQHRLEENDIKRHATERARAEMALANLALSRKIQEVESLQAALREQATQDALTGLFNRRHLNDTLPALLAMALREHQPLSVVVIDLDHFKAVNDTHGHPAGDLLLTAFGRLLRDQLRGSDQAFRYGGEEFCLLLPNTPAAAAAGKVQQLLLQWHEQVFALDSGVLRDLGFSAGVADTLQAAPTPVQLLHAADDLLLAAKRAGRRRVVHRPGPVLAAAATQG